MIKKGSEEIKKGCDMVKQIANDPEIEQILEERETTKRERNIDIIVYACVITITTVAIFVALRVLL